MRTAKELFAELNSFDENRRIEAKSASAVGKSMMETVCAFANEPGLRGGYLILGAKRTVCFCIGSIPGAVVGAFLIGLCEEIIKGLGQSTFSDAFTFALLIIVLCVKP